MVELIAGVVLLVVVFADVLETTLGAHGAGPVTRIISGRAFSLARGIRGAGGHWVHRYSGPATLMLVAFSWIALHWVAWTLIFLSDPGAVVLSETGAQARPLDVAAYVGSMLSTLGASRAKPGTAMWDVISALAAVNGMVVLTLSVTFVVNITRTVAEGRLFASLVNALDLDDPANVAHLRIELAGIASQFAAYPLAHAFSTVHRERRVVPAVATFVDHSLDERNVDTFRPILALLPGVDARGDLASVKASVRRWAERHTLGEALLRP